MNREELEKLSRSELIEIALDQARQVNELTELVNKLSKEVDRLKEQIGKNSSNSSKSPIIRS